MERSTVAPATTIRLAKEVRLCETEALPETLEVMMYLVSIVRRGAQAVTLGSALIIFVLSASSTHAQLASSPKLGPTFDEIRATYDGLTEAERRAVQDALVWTGDYNGSVDGSFGRQTFDAVLAYQRRQPAAAAGFQDAKVRAALIADAKNARDEAGFQLVHDKQSGIRLGVPLRLLHEREANQNRGRRWQSADGKITLDTRSNPPFDVDLEALYQRLVSVATPGRVITYKVLRPDYFVVAGETPTGKFYIRYAASSEGVRGFSVGYEKSLSKTFDRMAIAIANSFTPFPAEAASAEAPLVRDAPHGRSMASNLVGTGLVIGAHRVATAAALDACLSIKASGFKSTAVQRSEKGITFIDVAEALKPAPIRVTTQMADRERAVLVVAFTEDGGRRDLVVAPGMLEVDSRILAALQRGAAGAPVFDDSGALFGFVGPERDDRKPIAGVMPVGRHTVVVAPPNLASLAVDRGSVVGGLRSAAEVVSMQKEGIVTIECGL